MPGDGNVPRNRLAAYPTHNQPGHRFRDTAYLLIELFGIVITSASLNHAIKSFYNIPLYLHIFNFLAGTDVGRLEI